RGSAQGESCRAAGGLSRGARCGGGCAPRLARALRAAGLRRGSVRVYEPSVLTLTTRPLGGFFYAAARGLARRWGHAGATGDTPRGGGGGALSWRDAPPWYPGGTALDRARGEQRRGSRGGDPRAATV